MLPDGVEIDQAGTCVTASFNYSDLPAEALQIAVNECLERMRYSNARRFVIDLSGVEFFASECLNVLINFSREIEQVRGRIAVAGAGRNVAQVFYVTHLDRVFGLYEDPKDAAAAI